MASTIDLEEAKKFQHTKSEWWDPEGKFKTLHLTNPIRLSYIRTNVKKFFGIRDHDKPLQGLKILDIGCGGGLLSEPITRMGGKVTAIDISKPNISSAKEHAKDEGLAIDYQCVSVEQFMY